MRLYFETHDSYDFVHCGFKYNIKTQILWYQILGEALNKICRVKLLACDTSYLSSAHNSANDLLQAHNYTVNNIFQKFKHLGITYASFFTLLTMQAI